MMMSSDQISLGDEAAAHRKDDIVEDSTQRDVPRRGERIRTLTEKGLLHMLESKEKRLKCAYGNIKDKSDNINNLMNACASSREVQTVFSHWLSLYDEYVCLFDDVCSLTVDQDRLQSIQSWFETRHQLLKEFRISVNSWFVHTPETKCDDDDYNDTVSHASRRSKSSRTSSMLGSVLSAKLRGQQRKAELTARAESLKKKQALEKAKLNIKQEEEELAISTEIAVSEAINRVLDEFDVGANDDIHLPVVDKHLDLLTSKCTIDDRVEKPSSLRTGVDLVPSTLRTGVDFMVHQSFDAKTPGDYQVSEQCGNYPTKGDHVTFHRKQHPSTAMHVDAPSFIPSHHHRSNNHQGAYCESGSDSSRGSAVEETLLSVVRHLKKPQSDIFKFDGDPLTYNRFMRQFKTRIVPNTDNDDERLNFLEQYTSGEVNKIVVSYSYLDAKIGYKAALHELEDRYGDNEIIANCFIKKALKWPAIKPNDTKLLDEFAIFLVECENAVSSIDSIKILEYPDNMKKLVGKLPIFLHDRWRNKVHQFKENYRQISFHDLVSFIKNEAKKASHPVYGREAMLSESPDVSRRSSVSGHRTPQRSKGSFVGVTQTTDEQKRESIQVTHRSSDNTSMNVLANKRNAFQKPCLHCDDKLHSLDSCEVFKSLSFKERIQFLRTRGLCFGCLRLGHQKSVCRCKATCGVCNGRHPTVLHINSRSDFPTSTLPPRALDNVHPNIQSHLGAGSGDCTFAILPVKVRLKNSCTTVSTYAFLDNGSNVTFCSERLMERLGASGKKLRITVDTMGVPHTMSTFALKGLVLSDLDDQNSIQLDSVYTKQNIPATSHHIPQQEDINKWPHLKGIHLPQIDANIDILIGNNVADAYTPIDIRTGPRGSPYASKTLLGWAVWNLIRNSDHQQLSVNRAEMSVIQQIEDNRRLEQLFLRSMNMDFPERIIDDKKEDSVEDKRFRLKVDKSTEFVDGHYRLGLPFRDTVKLPNNKYQALQRLASLKKKLERNHDFKNDYIRFMDGVISKKYAEEVPDDELDRDDGRVWYIPHHGVYHPHKPGKIRVVFDCASRCYGVSLNSVLLQGPDLTSNLLGVLLKFREESVAIMADIESMFFQVRVAKEDTDCLRFLWWPQGDITREPMVYRMVVHLFGAVSSPSCANVALQRTAVDNQASFTSEMCDAVTKNFYVDDLLMSVSSEREAIAVVQNITDLCSRGGFRLTKWTSNSREVLHSIPVEERATEIKELDIDKEDLPTERALGVRWFVQCDQFGFKVAIRDLPPTRRNLLSLVSSVFDPLGFVSPFILKARMILQELCRRGVPWDQEIEGEDLHRWQEWLVELTRLDRFRIRRCLKPVGFGEVGTCEIHHFSDASDRAYGVISYVRLVNRAGVVHCAQIFSKARVNPLKKSTIPRLELTAATVAVRLNKIILDQLNYRIDSVSYWTDSMTVLKYIRNVTTRYHTFVANRVALIREASDVNQWRFVRTALNPADDVSRGLSVDALLESERWINGPDFLWRSKSDWPEQPEAVEISDDDAEIKTVNLAVEMENDTKSQDTISRFVSHFSDWIRLKKSIAWILVMKRCLRSWVHHRKLLSENIAREEPDSTRQHKLIDERMKKLKLDAMAESQQRLRDIRLNSAIMDQAERALCRYEQQKYFQKEVNMLNDHTAHPKLLPKKSSLYKLDPVIVDGLLRVGGRLQRAIISYDSKHPIILPAQSPISRLILSSVHQVVGHLGRNSILSELRQKFWIIRANTMIRGILSKCVVCRRYRARSQEQKMADLPVDRIVSGEPPFSRVGTDYFGPFQVKRGRSIVKRYGVIFTCLSTRAVHLELASSLDTDSCINAIRRFIARRGPVKVIWSDNGTNLVGAERELRQEIDRWNQSKMHSSLLQRGIDWHFNPPSGSHFGGVWERMIRSVRKVLFGLLQQQVVRLDDESLSTLFCEVESILNSRPITKMSEDSDDLEAITPNHLLLLGSGPTVPCGIYGKDDNYARRRWRQIQYLANVFWARWSREYLVTLQQRQKWRQPRVNVAVNDVVLIMDSSPRSSWTLGRVLRVISDKKGLVRMVEVKTASSVLCRPIHKLCLLLEAD